VLANIQRIYIEALGSVQPESDGQLRHISNSTPEPISILVTPATHPRQKLNSTSNTPETMTSRRIESYHKYAERICLKDYAKDTHPPGYYCPCLPTEFRKYSTKKVGDRYVCNNGVFPFLTAGAVTVHSFVALPGELRVKAGVVCWQVKLCDPHLSALEVRFSRRGAIQIDHLFFIFFIFPSFPPSSSIPYPPSRPTSLITPFPSSSREPRR